MYAEKQRGYKGIQHNIDLVLETRAHVSVEYDSHMDGYCLSKKRGCLSGILKNCHWFRRFH